MSSSIRVRGSRGTSRADGFDICHPDGGYEVSCRDRSDERRFLTVTCLQFRLHSVMCLNQLLKGFTRLSVCW